MPGKFQAIFMLEFSFKKAYGVMATTGTFNHINSSTF